MRRAGDTAPRKERRTVSTALLLLLPSLAFGACRGEIRFDEPEADGGDTSKSDANGAVDAPPPVTSCLDRACPSPLRCNAETKECVACLTNEDCAGTALPKCDPKTLRCVACLEDSHCGNERDCDSATRRCVDECDTDSVPCPNVEETCYVSEHVCARCKTDSNCASSPDGPRCDKSIYKCVECIGNADCDDPRPVCDRRDGKCVACLTGKDCATKQCNSVSRQCFSL